MGSDLVRPLGRGPDGEAAVGFPVGHAGHRFQESLVDGLGPVGLLEDVVGGLESLVYISPVGVQHGAVIAAQREPKTFEVRQVGMDHCSVFLDGHEGINDRLQVLVFHPYQLHGLSRAQFIVGCYGGHRLPDVEHLVPGHDSPVFDGPGAEVGIRKVCADDNRPDAGSFLRFRHVDAEDSSVAAWAG